MRWRFVGAAIGVLMMLTNVADAAVIGGSSSSSFLTADLTVAAIVSADVDIGPSISGTAPLAYDLNAPLVDVAADAGVAATITLVDVNATSVAASASSTVDGGFGSRNAVGTQSFQGFDLSIGVLPDIIAPPTIVPDVISITAEAITVTSTVDGDFGALASAGTLNVTNLQVFANGNLVATLNGDISENFNVVGLSTALAGATLTLNQQPSLTGDGASSRGLVTNAINLNLNDVNAGGVGLLSGDVLVGMTGASLNASAVPEPSSLAIFGLASVGGVYWSRRRRVASPRS
ncbi:protein containing DUF1559 [Rhodopirellula baltica SH28]|uniref:Protein containing DUF1559 n=1 Tax=Rhodopirellula baltica SH28 TaxID=993517 RepID=K5DCZ7_RHOBT|nr:protein containing DUF1559 [Rhodopirellula baltica SH28]